jgi:hypothetical protein
LPQKRGQRVGLAMNISNNVVGAIHYLHSIADYLSLSVCRCVRRCIALLSLWPEDLQ